MLLHLMENNATIFNNIRELRKITYTQEDCVKLLVKIRWDGKPICPDCGCDKTYYIKSRQIFKCANQKCLKPQFSVTTGTFMENTNLPLPDWFSIMEEFCIGLNAHRISKKLDINYRTVWFICHKLRNNMNFLKDMILDGEVEADEFIFNSKREENMIMSYRITAWNKKEKKKEQEIEGYKAKPYGNQRVMMNIKQRGGKNIVKLMGPSKKDITTKNFERILKENVSKDAILYIDTHPTHKWIDKEYFKDVKYITHTSNVAVLDDKGEIVLNKNGKPKTKKKKGFKDEFGNHTNSVENSNSHLNSHLKHYRKHSYKYFELYLAEYNFHCWCNEMSFLEKIRELLWNMKASHITNRELLALPNEYPEHKWKERKEYKYSGHSRKKKVKPVNFQFS